MIDDVTNKNTEYEFRIQKRIIAGGTGQTDLSRTGARTDHGFAPVSGATMTRAHSGRKTLRKEREKKIAHGHKDDNHAEEAAWQQTM